MSPETKDPGPSRDIVAAGMETTERWEWVRPLVVRVGVNALTHQIDIANARLQFRGGAAANVTASRISMARSRKLRIFQPHSYLSIDYATGDVQHYTLRRRPEGPPEISHPAVEVDEGEPLVREIEAFLDAAAGREDRGVSGEEGLRALEAGLRILSAIEETREAA